MWKLMKEDIFDIKILVNEDFGKNSARKKVKILR